VFVFERCLAHTDDHDHGAVLATVFMKRSRDTTATTPSTEKKRRIGATCTTAKQDEKKEEEKMKNATAGAVCVAVAGRALTAYTIGHGQRSLAEFVATLRACGVRHLVDIRRYPGSRKHPHFDAAALAHSLPEHGVVYTQLGGLGGRRSGTKEQRRRSPHSALRVDAFKNYAAHMDTPAFDTDLAALKTHARASPTAFMCAETPWWKCHRKMVSDALVADGWRVLHTGFEPRRPSATQQHVLWTTARVVPAATHSLAGECRCARLVYDVTK
jgi:hypothetical protein